MWVDALSALSRAASFIALFQAAGMAMFVAMFDRLLKESGRPTRRLGCVSAVAAMLLCVAHYSLEAARMTGELAGLLDVSLQRMVAHSPAGGVLVSRLTGLALIAIAIRHSGTAWKLAVSAGVLLVTFSFAFVGHTTSPREPGWLWLVLVAHVLVVAFWFGALLPLHAACRLEPVALAADVVSHFSRIATMLVPGLFLAGILLMVVLVDRWAVFREPYGQLLLIKVAVFSGLMVLAGLNKLRFGPRMTTDRTAVKALQRTVVAEYVLIAAVLGVTAVLTIFFSPDS